MKGRAVAVAFVAAMLLVVAVTAMAGGITFCDVCNGFKLKQLSDGLSIQCPVEGTNPVTYKEWMKIAGCIRASAIKRASDGRIVITCGPGSFGGATQGTTYGIGSTK